MSGGVDSSVAAALLAKDGWDIVGCFMRLGTPGDELESRYGLFRGDDSELRIGHQGMLLDHGCRRCTSRRNPASMSPFYVCNFKKDFGRIIDYFVAEYNDGRTPNPLRPVQ